jgi:hypothetical protein
LARALLKVVHPSFKHSFEIIGNGSAINRTVELFQQRLSNVDKYKLIKALCVLSLKIKNWK